MIYLREMTEQSKDFMTEYIKRVVDGGGTHLETIKEVEGQSHKAIETEQKKYGIITTISFEEIQIDLVNRGWILIPDQTHDQTNEVINFKFKSIRYKIDRKVKDKFVVNQCFLIAQSIKVLDWNYEVFIPYINKLRDLFPKEYLNVRRDVNKLTHLIEVITLWNQFNRRVVKIGQIRYLFSEFKDLELALEISLDLFINLMLHIDDSKRKILDLFDSIIEVNNQTKKKTVTQKTLDQTLFLERNKKIEKENFDKNKDDALTITEVYLKLRLKLGISRRTTQRRMNDLFYEGYLYREKVKGSFYFSKLKDYNILKALNFENLEAEIDDIVEIQYNFYNNTDEEMLEGAYDVKK